MHTLTIRCCYHAVITQNIATNHWLITSGPSTPDPWLADVSRWSRNKYRNIVTSSSQPPHPRTILRSRGAERRVQVSSHGTKYWALIGCYPVTSELWLVHQVSHSNNHGSQTVGREEVERLFQGVPRWPVIGWYLVTWPNTDLWLAVTGQGHGEEAGHGAEAGLRAVRLQQDAAVDPGHRRTVNTLGYYGFCQP